ncbi:iron-sulfur cluster assembly protein [Geodermatophilus sp. DSM 44513]|uniref:metal-sulfur cluster assembly factor n=1 Tax=Geodermatophilus sp. DSM 44513 TaxID=1528104 RepID=UPI00126E1769|nr:iron-sulfur cluster assembly protein [Geodermatophilus sp. DSM 44513]WNV77095.1 iron-sulfur cluster assembly protein [Geodermatophilus sp. DSM 44513]
MTDEAAVRAALDRVIDPCSVAAGAPAGLAELGIVREVAVTDGRDGRLVRVVLGLTDPTCMMGPSFVHSAREALLALPWVAGAEVTYDEDSTSWSPSDMAPHYRRRLSLVRSARVHGDRHRGPHDGACG